MCPPSVATPSVALNFFALVLASALCVRMPFGKYISFPSVESISKTYRFSFLIVSFSSPASGFMRNRLQQVLFRPRPGPRPRAAAGAADALSLTRKNPHFTPRAG